MTLEKLTPEEWQALRPGDEVAYVRHNSDAPRIAYIGRRDKGGWALINTPAFLAGTYSPITVRARGRNAWLVRITDEVRAYVARERRNGRINNWLWLIVDNLKILPEPVLELLDEARQTHEPDQDTP